MIENTDPKTIAKLSLGDFNIKNPVPYLPSPTDYDYEVGFIDRYFVQKINDYTIIETSPRDYESVNSKFFNKATINWQIRGVQKNTYNGNILVEYGVGEYNKRQILKSVKKIPGIQNVLLNYFQYWLGY